MATTAGSPVDQLTTSNRSLSEYYRQLAEYLTNAGALPDFASVLDKLEYDELLRRADQDANGSASAATATAVEEIHNNAAHVREYAMTNRNKAEIYLAMQSEYTQSAEYHDDRAALLVSLLRGQTRVPYLP